MCICTYVDLRLRFPTADGITGARTGLKIKGFKGKEEGAGRRMERERGEKEQVALMILRKVLSEHRAFGGLHFRLNRELSPELSLCAVETAYDVITRRIIVRVIRFVECHVDRSRATLLPE